MDVVRIELLDGTKGRDFVSFGPGGLEKFSARLFDGQTSLQVGWTDHVPLTALRIREVQRLAGVGSFTRITGTASDELETAIRTGRFSSGKAAELLGRSLGGKWEVAIVARFTSGVLDIIAQQAGEQT